MQSQKRTQVRLAATIVLVRDKPTGLEVYMMQRPGRGDFPELHVFPGGKVSPEDNLPHLCAGVVESQADRQLGVSGALRYWAAAIRECFEECGVLLATRSGRTLGDVELQALQRDRHALADATLPLDEFCRTNDLALACDRVQYFSHWLTPEVAPARFDTRFFLAELPEGQRTRAHESELVGGEWIRPGVALGKAAEGRVEDDCADANHAPDAG